MPKKLNIYKKSKNNEGPSIRFSIRCDFCKYLKIDDHPFVDENGEHAYKINRVCKKKDRIIPVYDLDYTLTPEWCPFLNKDQVKQIFILIKSPKKI